MQQINIPLRGSRAQVVCAREVTDDFLLERSKLGTDGLKAVERLVESFDSRPESRGDILFPSTPVGAAHTRFDGGFYIFFQRFNAAHPLRYLIKLWWCGTYATGFGGPKFDFENLEE